MESKLNTIQIYVKKVSTKFPAYDGEVRAVNGMRFFRLGLEDALLPRLALQLVPHILVVGGVTVSAVRLHVGAARGRVVAAVFARRRVAVGGILLLVQFRFRFYSGLGILAHVHDTHFVTIFRFNCCG